MSTIFVMVPSYRDPDLLSTIQEVYYKAANPDKLRIAIGIQEESAEDIPDFSFIPHSQLIYITLHPNNRPGIRKLREALCNFYAGEDYFLSIDSHTKMSENWDEDLIGVYHRVSKEYKNPKVILREAMNYDDKTYKDMSVNFKHFSSLEGVELVGALQSDFSKPKNKNGFPISHYLLVGNFFAPGSLAHDITWSGGISRTQEEGHITFELFLKGWDVRLMLDRPNHVRIFHAPDNYYAKVYSVVDGWRGIHDTFLLYDHPGYRSRHEEGLEQLYLFNRGPYMVHDSARTPREFWKAVGQEKLYDQLISIKKCIY